MNEEEERRQQGTFPWLRDRLKMLWQARHRADVLDSLPAEAPAGYQFVVRGDPNLYIGTGQGLRKVPTQPV